MSNIYLNPTDESVRITNPANAEDVAAIDANTAKGGVVSTLRGVGTKNGATVDVKETCFGNFHYTEFTLTNTPLSVVSVTTGNGVGGVKIYDFPEGHINVLGTVGNLSLSIASAKQADFTDGTPEGDVGIGTVLPANADALGTDATDDDLGTATAFTMTSYADASITIPPDSAAVKFDGTSTAKDINVTLLVDAADIDDDTTSEILCSGTIKVFWLNLGDY